MTGHRPGPTRPESGRAECRPGLKDPAYVRALFERNAESYDSVNHVISLGRISAWRRRLVDMTDPLPGERLLDAFSGPGRLGVRCLDRVGRHGQVVFADISPSMLDVARRSVRTHYRSSPLEKAVSRHLSLRNTGSAAPASFVETDLAAGSPFAASSFDVILLGFALRYVEDPAAVLHRLSGLLRSGGRLGVLEFVRPVDRGVGGAILGMPARWYFNNLLPTVAGHLAGEAELYEVLRTTSERFWTDRELREAMAAAGLSRMYGESRAGGLLTITMGYRSGSGP